MNLLDRYCAMEFIKYFAIIIASFVFLYLIIDFFEKIRMFISNQATIYQIASFFFFSIPMIIWQVLPTVILVASLVAFGSLSHDNEILAMKACGVSLYRISVPVIAMASLLGLFAFLLSEFVTPYTNDTANNIKRIEIQKQQTLGAFKQNQLWYRGKEGIYNFKAFDSRTASLRGITIYYLDKQLHLTKRVDAERGEWVNGRWTFYNAITSVFSPEAFPQLQAMPAIAMDIPETPDNFKTVQKDADNMGYFELRRYVREIQAEGYDATVYLTDMHSKLAYPLVNLIMAVIGISFAMHWERKGGKTWGIAAGILIGFSYWLVFALTVSLGRAGTMPPLLAAWTADILFGIAASIMFLRIRT